MRFTVGSSSSRATSPLEAQAPKLALEHLLRESRPDHKLGSWLSCNASAAALCPSSYHPFVAAAQLAFAEHRPLKFGPEQVWLLISQGFANHINEHAEALRTRFVKHEGKKKLVVRRDDFVLDAPDNPWHEVIDAFCDQVKTHVGRRYDLMVSDFSTTTSISRTASCVTMMDALQSYFEYELRTLCGIPEFELLGQVQDWESIKQRVQALAEFELDWWVSALLPVMDQFIATAKGEVDKDFWQSFFKFGGQSGGPYIHGWINQFFPYLRRGEKLERNPYLEEGTQEMFGPTTDQIPSALSQAPVRWEYHGQSIPLQFLGGFLGVAQDEDLTLSPDIGWAVIRETKSS